MRPNARPRRPALLIATTAVVLVLFGGLIAGEVLEGQANPLAVWNFEWSNANADLAGPVSLLWSMETYNDTLSVEGPPGAAAPTALRLVRSTGETVGEFPMVPLDPAINVSICPGRRPPKGASWWSRAVPSDMATDLRERGTTLHRIAVLVRGEWRPTVLLDSGCRGVARG